MALSAKIGTFLSASANGTQIVTGAGFQPSIVLFMMSSATTDSLGTNWRFSLGGGISSSKEGGVATMAFDAQATMQEQRSFRTTKAITKVSSVNPSTPVIIGEADLTSLDSDGFTLTWSSVGVTTNPSIVGYLALAGSDLTGVNIGSFNYGTATGTLGVTGCGFQPDALMFLNTNSTTTEGAASGGVFSLGAAMSSSSRWALCYTDSTNVTTSDTQTGQVTDKCILKIDSTAAVTTDADFVSMDSDGFTINRTTTPAADQKFVYIAFKGGQYKLGSFDQPATVSTQPVTGVGFQPAALFLASDSKANHAAPSTQMNLALGMGISSTERIAMSMLSMHNLADSQTGRYCFSDHVIGHISGSAPDINAESDIETMDADGFTLDWTTADATARRMLYLAFGSAASGNVTCTPSAAVISVVLPQVSTVITGGALVTVTPAVAPISIVLPQATAVITGGVLLTVTPSVVAISVVVPSVTSSVSSMAIVTTPSAAVIQIVCPSPAVVVTSGNTVVVTTQAAQISIVLPGATSSVIQPFVTTQAGVATISIVVPAASMTSGIGGQGANIQLQILLTSKMDKTLRHNSRVEKFMVKESEMDKTFTLESSLIND